eukprot:8142052-Pyramimonas_sp.AAC.1
MKASAVSYTGEKVHPSEPSNLERLVEAPPQASAAASSVDVPSVCEGWVRRALQGGPPICFGRSFLRLARTCGGAPIVGSMAAVA